MKLKLSLALSFLAVQVFSQDIEKFYSELNPSVVTILVKENKLVTLSVACPEAAKLCLSNKNSMEIY